ncbi:MAG: MFS transporter [Alphaproteobacteria bacterium]|nr:MAG: MFS transporter [Alphaproteobacteria bacterium]TMJ99285.1 MAG: MFS transporter [Alphaproteobacteria bacterium]
MPEPAAASSLTRHPSFVLFWCARTFTNGAYMMQGVAVGWQIYELTNDPFDLGLVGLAQFVPLVGFSLIIGQVADLFDRRLVVASCQLSKAVAALALAIGTARGALSRDAMLAILFVSGTARAFEIPTIHALLPGIVPARLLPRAIAASASAQQTAVICGPSLGGLLYMLSPTGVYATCTIVFIAASVLISLIHIAPRTEERKPISLETLFAGFRYIRSRPVLLGAISLDLFAVLLGGVTALLPIYARDILETGPWALGVLRSAPAVGALATSIVLARHAIGGAGHLMFAAVGMFGLASLAFGLSTSLVVSFLALMVYGASDAISVIIRQSLVQMRTPYEMLGRVLAVNSMFTGSSGSLGEFRAGAVAAALGAVPSALIGGFGTIAVMLIWMWAFPQLRRVDKLAPDAEAGK